MWTQTPTAMVLRIATTNVHLTLLRRRQANVDAMSWSPQSAVRPCVAFATVVYPIGETGLPAAQNVAGALTNAHAQCWSLLPMEVRHALPSKKRKSAIPILAQVSVAMACLGCRCASHPCLCTLCHCLL